MAQVETKKSVFLELFKNGLSDLAEIFTTENERASKIALESEPDANSYALWPRLKLKNQSFLDYSKMV